MPVNTYRKKPVTIEAVKWTGTPESTREVVEFMTNAGAVETEEGDLLLGTMEICIVEESGELLIRTLEGTMKASEGDYIIRGVAGEFYPCKPDIFEETYEEVISLSYLTSARL